MQVTLEYAEQHLADLVSATDRGEDVEIERPGKPNLHLVIRDIAKVAPNQGRRILGAGAHPGQAPLPSDVEWQAMKEELADLMLNGPVFPPEE